MKFNVTLGILPDSILQAQSPSVKRPTFASPLIKLQFDRNQAEWVVRTLLECNAQNTENPIYYDENNLELTFYFMSYIKTENGKDFFAPLSLVHTHSDLSLLQHFIGDSKLVNEIVLALVSLIGNNRDYLDKQPIDFQDYDQEAKMLFDLAGLIKQFLSNTLVLKRSYFSLLPDALLKEMSDKFFSVTKSLFLNHRLTNRNTMMAQILSILDYEIPKTRYNLGFMAITSKSPTWKFIGNLIAIDNLEHKNKMIQILNPLVFRGILKFIPIHYSRALSCMSVLKQGAKKEAYIHKESDFIMITEIDEEKLSRYFRNIIASPKICPSNAYQRFCYFWDSPGDIELELPEENSLYNIHFIEGRDELVNLAGELQDLKALLRDLIALDSLDQAPVTVGDIRPYLTRRRNLLKQIHDTDTSTQLELVSDLYDAYRTKQFLESHPNLLLNDKSGYTY